MPEHVTKKRQRDPEATQRRILNAATQEFARHGLGGARIDRIAARAKANKRMIYHYFGGKDALFQAVLERAYGDIRAAERALKLDDLAPAAAMDRLVEFTWRYYLDNPAFLTLVNSENLHRGRHLSKSKAIREIHKPFVDMVQGILDRGVKQGVFRKGIDAVQLNITIAAIGYYYLTNRFTGAIIYGQDLMDAKTLDQRLAFNLETIRRLIRTGD